MADDREAHSIFGEVRRMVRTSGAVTGMAATQSRAVPRTTKPTPDLLIRTAISTSPRSMRPMHIPSGVMKTVAILER